MINTNVFDYVNILDKAADASWTRNETIANNIANVSTPNYKRQEVSFESNLQKALLATGENSLGNMVKDVNLNKVESDIYTDAKNFSYRLDGNNVDIDTENVAMAENQIKYQGLINSINNQFSNLKIVMK
jgi:flagellar basal-body rod protein FlgB